MTDFTKDEKNIISQMTEDAIREFFAENRLYEELITDMAECFPELYRVPRGRWPKKGGIEKTLAASIGPAKVIKEVEKYVSQSRLILHAEMGEEYPAELTEEVYQELVKNALFANRDILKTLVGSVAVTALCDQFYYPRLIHELMHEVSDAYDQEQR